MQYRYVSAFVYPVGFPLDTISDLIWLGNYLRNTMLQGLRILSVLCTRTYGLYMGFRSSVRAHILSTSYAQQTYVRTHDKYVRTHARIDYVRFNVCDPLMSWSPTNVMSGSPTNLLSCLVVAICRKGTCAMIKIGTNNTVPIPGQFLIRQLQSCIGSQLWQHQFPSVVKLPPNVGHHGFCYSLCALSRLHQHIRTRLHLASPG